MTLESMLEYDTIFDLKFGEAGLTYHCYICSYWESSEWSPYYSSYYHCTSRTGTTF
jgi:hypothetical protein